MANQSTTPLSSNYIDRIYRYCYKRTQNSYDAEDLAQEITLEVLRAWHSGVRPVNFEAWLWTVARHRWFKFVERQQRSRSNMPYVEGGQDIDTYTTQTDGVDNRLIADDVKWELTVAISRLAKAYRETVVQYYLESLPIPQIASRLAIPEGTVKRRLYDARQQLRKGMEDMQEHGRSSYAPVQLNLWGGFGIPNYWHDLEKGLTKNILAVAHDTPVSVPEMAAELVVASYYIEEELEWLVKHRFVKKVGHNQYLTDFLIFDSSLYTKFRRAAGDAWDGLGSRLVEALDHAKPQIMSLDFYGKEFPWRYLLWIFIVFACTSYSKGALNRYKEKWEGKGLPTYTKKYRIAGTVRRGQEPPVGGPVRSVSWSNLHQQFANVCGHRNVEYANLYQAKPFADRDDLINAANIGVLLRLAENGKASLSESESEAAAVLVSKGVVARNNGEFAPQLPIMTGRVRSQIQNAINVAVTEFVDSSKADEVARLADEILLPHVRKDLLEEYVNWIMLGCLSPLNYVLYQCREEGALALPEDYEKAAHALYITID